MLYFYRCVPRRIRNAIPPHIRPHPILASPFALEFESIANLNASLLNFNIYYKSQKRMRRRRAKKNGYAVIDLSRWCCVCGTESSGHSCSRNTWKDTEYGVLDDGCRGERRAPSDECGTIFYMLANQPEPTAVAISNKYRQLIILSLLFIILITFYYY